MQHRPNRIVVGVDCSASSLNAFAWALGEAARSSAEVEVILVWSDPWSPFFSSSTLSAGEKKVARLKELLALRVEQVMRDEKVETVPVVHRVLSGDPAETLVAAAGGAARLLVVGTTGLTGLRRWMLGSVSQRCVQLSPVPVVVVPRPGDDGGQGADSDRGPLTEESMQTRQ